jgi:hypothetical protein
VRADEGIGKGYVWAFGVSGSGVYINGPYKFFDGHHFQDTGSVPVEKLFGNVPPYPSRDTVATETQAVKPPAKPTPAQEPPHLLTPLAALWPTATLREPPRAPETAVKPTAPQRVKVTFVLLEPGAKQVFLCGEFNGWASDATPMKRDDAGHWETTLALAPGRHEYKFLVDGNWRHDPLARVNVWNQNGTLNSVAQVWA